MKQRRKFHAIQKLYSEYQEQTIETAREIAETYIESQKEIINALQSACAPYVETFYSRTWSPVMSARRISEVYANVVSNHADNFVTATRLTNNMVFAGMEAFGKLHSNKQRKL